MKQALKEFFEGSSISRTPKFYKEYRDFIINKYREDPSHRFTFTEIHKSLIDDVTLLHKVFCFLEAWGLITFVAPPPPRKGSENDDRVRVKNETSNGVWVIATPNSLRSLSVEVVKGKNSSDGVEEIGVKLPPLASYSDVFGDLKRLHYGSCGDNCDSGFGIQGNVGTSVGGSVGFSVGGSVGSSIGVPVGVNVIGANVIGGNVIGGIGGKNGDLIGGNGGNNDNVIGDTSISDTC
ncbi:hypothetical protein GOBAR_AA05219 [Gossypium barbadense]|uniref:SWIRM domain-containing protein n=1 Tax=Gossypium barbadense TaxID=3634 RepID=A0A2P5YIC7_GOSBA|nr:hypothetical protein GOBAR_AA05219 [Gossypium barbadense]